MNPLSKSKIMAHRQCPKRLWLEIHRPELKENSSGAQSGFRVGNTLGEVARDIYGQNRAGVLIDPQDTGYAAAFSRSELLLRTSETLIFEAGLKAGEVFAFADLMIPVRRDGEVGWKMVEVKSSTTVKEYHRDDVAIQAFLAREMGINLSEVAIACVDSSWVYRKKAQFQGLLKEEDLTKEIELRHREVKNWIKEARDIAGLAKEPKQDVGAHCYEPYECGFCQYCNRQLDQTEFPVDWFPRLTKKQKLEFEARGIVDMKDVPEELLSSRQALVRRHTIDQSVHFDSIGAKRELRRTGYPAYFLDFETINLVVPLWIGSKPYQQIPFQFSLHRVGRDGHLHHEEFLDVSGKDPRKMLAEALIAACGERGPVFAYNASFEAGVIRALAEKFPRYAAKLLAIEARIVDLRPITERNFYHPSQQGSWSIKKVLPGAVPELSYGSLQGVKDGGMAMEAYNEAIQAETSPERIEQIRAELLAYCHLDTLAMVGLWKFFLGLDKPKLS